MAYELLLAQTLSSLLGNTVLRYTVTIGLYIFSLGMGAFFCDRFPGKSTLQRLINLECYLAIAGSLSPVLFFFIDHQTQTFLSFNADAQWPSWFRTILLHAWIVKLGFISGMEIPLLMQLGDDMDGPRLANRVLAIDYFGTFFAAIYFPLILFPSIGLFAAAAFIGFINCLAALGLLLIDSRSLKERAAPMAAINLLAIWLAISLGYEKQVSAFIMSNLFTGVISG